VREWTVTAGKEASMSKGIDLSGKVALVTGGSKGIGQAIALAFSEAGADVGIVSRDEMALEGVLARLRTMSGRAEAFAADISRVDEIEHMVNRVKSTLGPVDILVNSAGIAIPEPALSVSEETWCKTIDTNLKGQFFCASRIGRDMIERRTGAIINVSSEEGLVAVSGHVAYCISKAGIIHMTKVLAVEWGEFGVRVNCIAPAAVRTQMNEGYWLGDEQAYRWVVSRIPLGRVSEVEEMTGAALFLASDASSFVTGAVLVVDGGVSAGLPRRM
jgi:NAD(P)-dependent dehydrogenase (short-subunit alcohol dehydrogenase family)